MERVLGLPGEELSFFLLAKCFENLQDGKAGVEGNAKRPGQMPRPTKEKD